MSLIDILARLTAANDEQHLGMTPRDLYRLAQRHHSRISQRVPECLGGTLSYADSTGNAGVARAMRRNRKRIPA